MFSVEAEGLGTLREAFEALPTTVLQALQAKAASLGEALGRHVVEDKLSGQVLAARSGRLRSAIGAEVVVDGDAVRSSVFVGGDVPYAAIHEFGGHTAPHIIVADKARALAFVYGGKTAFFHMVHHPGSAIPERSYLRSGLADMAPQILAELKATALEAAAMGVRS